MNANPTFADDEMISSAVEKNWKKGRVTHLLLLLLLLLLFLLFLFLLLLLLLFSL